MTAFGKSASLLGEPYGNFAYSSESPSSSCHYHWETKEQRGKSPLTTAPSRGERKHHWSLPRIHHLLAVTGSSSLSSLSDDGPDNQLVTRFFLFRLGKRPLIIWNIKVHSSIPHRILVGVWWSILELVSFSDWIRATWWENEIAKIKIGKLDFGVFVFYLFGIEVLVAGFKMNPAQEGAILTNPNLTRSLPYTFFLMAKYSP